MFYEGGGVGGARNSCVDPPGRQFNMDERKNSEESAGVVLMATPPVHRAERDPDRLMLD